MKKQLPLIVTLILLTVNALGQLQYADSTRVSYYPANLDSISLIPPHHLEPSTFHANQFDPIIQNTTLYSTLSNIGTAHKNIRFPFPNQIGFDMSLPSLSNFIKTEKDLKTYLSILPYSEARYVMTTGDKEQHLRFSFGRQIIQDLFLSFEYNINFSPGIYSNSKTDNNYFWINLLYSTKNQRYRAQAYWFRNKLDIQENGGIVFDSVYYNQQETDNSVILTNLSDATNFVKVSGAGLQHCFNLSPPSLTETSQNSPNLPNDSINTLPLNDTINTLPLNDTTNTLPLNDTINTLPLNDTTNVNLPHDSISEQPKKTKRLNLGRINHHFAYQRNQLFYNETNTSLPFYAPFDTLLSSITTDTILLHAFHNSLQWNTLGYKKYSDDVPFYLYAGIDYSFYRQKYYDYLEKETIIDRSYSQLILSGGIIANLFKSTNLSAKAEVVALGYQIGDFSLQGKWRQFLGNKNRNFGQLTVEFDMKRQSPTWFETKYHSNHFRWENQFHPATYLVFNAHYQFKSFRVGAKQTTVNDLIYFDPSAHPAQYDGFISIRELYGYFRYTLWRFQFEGFLTLQKANNEEIVHLPLFLGKLKVGFQQPIFKKAAILQPSITVHYFTKYYADAYMPALRTFYLQNDVQIGNFPFIDVALAINVKQADIFVQYSNMFLLTGNHHSFIAPHYPMRDSKIFLGVNWRLFN